jgi:hypothetical protein
MDGEVWYAQTRDPRAYLHAQSRRLRGQTAPVEQLWIRQRNKSYSAYPISEICSLPRFIQVLDF